MRFVAFWFAAAIVCRIAGRSLSKLMGLYDVLDPEMSFDLDFLCDFGSGVGLGGRGGAEVDAIFR